MWKVLARRPSPALIVAVIALVAAVGGGALAAPRAHRAASSKINGSRIKVHSISGNRLRNNTVTGTQVRESSLGEVPEAKLAESATTAANANSAGHATTAGSATTATTAASADAVKGYQVLPFTRVAATDVSSLAGPFPAATETDLFTRGPITVYLRCLHYTVSNGTVAWFFMKTSQNGALMTGDEAVHAGGDGSDVVNTDTPEFNRYVAAGQANHNSAGYTQEKESITAPDGSSFTVNLEYGDKEGTLPAGNGVFGSGNGCFYHGEVLG